MGNYLNEVSLKDKMVEVTNETLQEKQDLLDIEQSMMDALLTIKKRLHEDISFEGFNEDSEIIDDWKKHATAIIFKNNSNNQSRYQQLDHE